MDNLESSPQLLIPTIPATDCPPGNIAAVFNYFFQNYMGQATINVPGLGDVTPAEIVALQQADITLKSQIDAISGSVRSGTLAVVATDSTVAVSFATMPSANYSILIELSDTGGVGTAPAGWAVVSGTKTSTSFSIRFTDIPASGTSFFWVIRQLF